MTEQQRAPTTLRPDARGRRPTRPKPAPATLRPPRPAADSRRAMTTVAAVAFPDESAAIAAAEQLRSRALDIPLEADSMAVIVCDRRGIFHTTTHYHAVPDGSMRGVFWLLLFSTLFFVPSFGLVVGADLTPLMRRIERAGIDDAFRHRVRDLLRPGTSALFLSPGPTVPADALAELARFGGTVLTSALPTDTAEGKAHMVNT
jgi:uncharacterized membrane protein